MQMELDKIESTKKRIKPIQLALELEKAQLDQDVQKLNEIMNEQEEAVNNYIAALRQEVEKAKKYLSQDTLQEHVTKNSADAQQDTKLDLEKALPSKPTLQAVLNQMSKVSSTSKRLQALKTTLESEKERLNIDVKDVIQTVEDREQAFENYVDKVKEHIKQLRTDLIGQEK
jgi:DNA-binding FrmR family transcriptional regulator